jgi:Kef-type K+ transport system membrane component KefB
MGLLAVIGICVLGGTLGAWLFQRMHVPQVVGYIVIGVLIGQSGLHMIKSADIAALRPVNMFALGLIGFLVGGELHGSTFKKYGRQFTGILLGEGLAAFILVALPSTLILFAVTRDWALAAAGGVMLGAIASATDPASTIDVLWEYKTAGILTTTIIAIVALDDALAMTLYAVGTSVSQVLTNSDASISAQLVQVSIELFGSLTLGVSAGFALNLILRFLPQKERRLGLALGVILLTIGVSILYGMDVILATMAIGVVLANSAPRRSRELFEILRSFAAPIYILFFVLVGARLDVRGMPSWIWILVAVYVTMRSIGKWSGSFIGNRLSGGDQAVGRLLGLSLFAQGGVAVGLSIVASQHLQGIAITDTLNLGDMIVFTVTATTLIVQLLGPPCTKLAVRMAGEIDRNLREEDIIAKLKVADVMDGEVHFIPENAPLAMVIEQLLNDEALVHPVLAGDGRACGMLNFESLKDVMLDSGSWQWLLASDVMDPVQDSAAPGDALADVLDDMQSAHIEALPVLTAVDGGQIAGVLDLRTARRRVREELIRQTSAKS